MLKHTNLRCLTLTYQWDHGPLNIPLSLHTMVNDSAQALRQCEVTVNTINVV